MYLKGEIKLGSLRTAECISGVGILDGIAPFRNGDPGYHPRKILQILRAKWGISGQKIALSFYCKQSAILTQTFGYKRFSEVA